MIESRNNRVSYRLPSTDRIQNDYRQNGLGNQLNRLASTLAAANSPAKVDSNRIDDSAVIWAVPILRRAIADVVLSGLPPQADIIAEKYDRQIQDAKNLVANLGIKNISISLLCQEGYSQYSIVKLAIDSEITATYNPTTYQV